MKLQKLSKLDLNFNDDIFNFYKKKITSENEIQLVIYQTMINFSLSTLRQNIRQI